MLQNCPVLDTPNISKLEYLIVTLLIFLSGNPPFVNRYYYPIAGGLALLYIIQKGRAQSFNALKNYCIFFILLSLCQLFVLGSVSCLGVLNFLFKITFGAVVMFKLGSRFRYAYFNLMYVFALISIVLYTAQLMGVRIPVLWNNGYVTNSIFIYNWSTESDGIPRNAGVFWEPGAFSAYILLVPLLYFKEIKFLFINRNFKKKTIILLIALLTTTSTTGFVILSLIALYYYSTKSSNFLKTVCVYLPILLTSFYFAYNHFDFLGGKIKNQIETGNEIKGEYATSRYGAYLFDLHYIKKHPLVGNGLDEKTRFADHPFLWGESLGMGNGLSGYLANWGIIALLVYCVLLYKGLPFEPRDKIIFLLIVLLQFNGEYLLNYPLYLALPFIKFPRMKL